jgi:hypothetical protein
MFCLKVVTVTSCQKLLIIFALFNTIEILMIGLNFQFTLCAVCTWKYTTIHFRWIWNYIKMAWYIIWSQKNNSRVSQYIKQHQCNTNWL